MQMMCMQAHYMSSRWKKDELQIFQINQVIEANWQQRALLWQKRWLGDRDQLARLLAAAGQHLSVK
ncbi:hypothetical protein T01_1620 [Trichinella spiralis]|uniref:Uncharacterized protein n=1 Tax=Trichinella spiralis TaxID=6334 RepID=A0A0V1B250_TRISP|nr:hypothetical protein T01_1620 [Trichinella spiralis]